MSRLPSSAAAKPAGRRSRKRAKVVIALFADCVAKETCASARQDEEEVESALARWLCPGGCIRIRHIQKCRARCHVERCSRDRASSRGSWKQKNRPKGQVLCGRDRCCWVHHRSPKPEVPNREAVGVFATLEGARETSPSAKRNQGGWTNPRAPRPSIGEGTPRLVPRSRPPVTERTYLAMHTKQQ